MRQWGRRQGVGGRVKNRTERRGRRGVRPRRGVWRKHLGALAILCLGLGAFPALAVASDWNDGDVFAGIANGTYNVYDNSGNFKEPITDGLGGFTTGCAFNPARTVLYTTNFSNARVPTYETPHPHTLDTSINPGAQGGGGTESVVFDQAGNFYVGNASGNADVQKYDSSNNFVQSFNVATQNVGSDWIDLASDQQTLFYTSEGSTIFRYDVASDTQLPPFATGIGSRNFALRLLPPGDGSGGLLAASSEDIKRLDGSGNVVQTYDAPGENGWFSLNLDPNRQSFWSGDLGTQNFYRFNLGTGAVEVGPIASGGSLFGLCVKGEPTAAIPPEEPPEEPPPPPPPAPTVSPPCGNVVIGGASKDNITGTEGGDLIRGRQGNDRLNGANGDDCVRGGPGSDRVGGGDGDDQLNGGQKPDRVVGGSGDDLIKVRAGRIDLVRCGSGNDTVRAQRTDIVGKDCEKVRIG
jgi:Ca2+-binding RTX toxin-like protein